jgi:hypothetical protein
VTLDSFNSFDDLFKDEESTIIPDFIDFLIDNPSKDVYKTFNDKYKKYKELDEIALPNKEQRLDMAILGEEMGILIARDFDFNDQEVANRKKEYVEFARERLVDATRKPYYRPVAMLFYIKALYGQTNIAFNLDGDNRKINIGIGNDYVTRVERYTDDRSLKAYVIALRAYRLLMDGYLLELAQEDRNKKIEKELQYAALWDENNYLAVYALGLVYLNKSWDTYSEEKAKEQFKKIVKLEKVEVGLDKYIDENEKQRIITMAKRKLSELK